MFQDCELCVALCIMSSCSSAYRVRFKGVNVCNLPLIDFLSPLSRRPVCEVQSPTMHRRQQTVPLSWTCRHQLTGCAGWIRFHTGLHSNRLLFFFSCIFSRKGFCLLELWFYFSFFYFFGLLCIQFMLFHQNPHNGFPQHTCSPLAQCVFWLCFVSFMWRHAQYLSFRTDILHSWKMCLLAEITRQRNCE